VALAFNVGNEASQPECEAMPRVVALQMSAPRDFDIVDVGTTSWAPPRAAPGEKPGHFRSYQHRPARCQV